MTIIRRIGDPGLENFGNGWRIRVMSERCRRISQRGMVRALQRSAVAAVFVPAKAEPALDKTRHMEPLREVDRVVARIRRRHLDLVEDVTQAHTDFGRRQPEARPALCGHVAQERHRHHASGADHPPDHLFHSLTGLRSRCTGAHAVTPSHGHEISWPKPQNCPPKEACAEDLREKMCRHRAKGAPCQSLPTALRSMQENTH